MGRLLGVLAKVSDVYSYLPGKRSGNNELSFCLHLLSAEVTGLGRHGQLSGTVAAVVSCRENRFPREQDEPTPTAAVLHNSTFKTSELVPLTPVDLNLVSTVLTQIPWGY